MQQVLTEELPPLSQRKPDLGSQFDSVLAKATARRAEQRFRSAEEFLHALNRTEFDAPKPARADLPAPAPVPATVKAAAGAVTMDSGAQDRLISALRNAVGPIAPILWRNALRESSSAAECRAALAAQITESQAREAFLQATLDTRAGAAAPAADGQVNVSMTPGEWPLHLAQLQRLMARLSEEIGPMASLLVERAASRAASREEFVARMTEVLPAGVMSEDWRAALGD
jgi:serine/threonine-protein kinase